MSANDLVLSSNIEKLRREQKALRTQLQHVVEEYEYISQTINPAIREKYHEKFGDMERSIQMKTFEKLEISRREELLRTRIERGETITKKLISLINTFVDKEFARFRKQMDSAHNQTSAQRNQEKIERLKKEEEEELPQVYRLIVKKLHPDSHTKDDSEYARYWHVAQAAYKQKNLTRLRSILELIGASTAKEPTEQEPTSPTTIEQIQEEIAALKATLRREEHKLATLKNEQPYTLRNVIDNHSWRASQIENLQAELDGLQYAIDKHRAFLSSIVGENWEDFVKVLRQEQKDIEDASPDETPYISDFMKDTYFGMR